LYKELGETWDEFKNADSSKKANMIGELVGGAVTEFLIGKGIGKAAGILAKTKTGAALLAKAENTAVAVTAKVVNKFSDNAASLARKRLVSGLVGMGANSPLPASFLKDFATIAGNKLKNGTVKFADFAKQMVDEFGDRVKPHLEKLYRENLIELGLGKEIDEIGIKATKLKNVKPIPDAILDPPKAVRRKDLAGKTHPVTNVPYDRNGYPIFNSAFDAQLPKNMRGRSVSDYEQFKEATKQLKKEIESDPMAGNIFTKDQLADIMAEKDKIRGLTWHHHQDGVRLQLVDSKVHAKSGHDGGRKNTGGRTK
jgi:hypothetical protein